MVEQVIITFLSLILGSALTMAVNHLSYRQSKKADKEKILREKIEEAYILLDQLKEQVDLDLATLFKIEGANMSYVGIQNEYSDKITKRADIDTHKLRMLVNLYASSQKGKFEEYIGLTDHAEVARSLSEIEEGKEEKLSRLSLFAKYALGSLKKDSTLDPENVKELIYLIKPTISQEDNKDAYEKLILSFLIYLQSAVERHYRELTTAIEKLILKI